MIWRMLLILRFALCLSFVLPPAVFAAVGSSAVNTWYTRPPTVCEFNGDGLAYGCAVSNGAAGAFSGMSNIIWTATVGVDDRDTLYVCGDHFQELVAAQSGGSLTTPIIIDGACPSDPGSIDTSALSGAIEMIDLTSRSFITVQNFGAGNYRTGAYTRIGLRGAKRHGILVFSSSVNRSGITIQDNVIDNRTASNAANTCHAIYFSGSGTTRYSDMTVQRNVILGTPTGCNNGNNDDINVELADGAFLVQDNYTTGGHEGIDVSSGASSGMIIRRNITPFNLVSGIKIHGNTVCPVGLQAYGNLSYGNGIWGMIVQDIQNSFINNNTIWQVGGSDPREAMNYELVNACTMTGNTLLNNIIVGNYGTGTIRVGTDTRAQFEANTLNGNLIYQTGSQTTQIYFNNDAANNVTTANFGTWISAHTKDLNVSPTLIAPSSYNFRTTGASTLRRAGVPTAICMDVRNRTCWTPPDIGAYQATGGDVRGTITTRSIKPARSTNSARGTLTPGTY